MLASSFAIRMKHAETLLVLAIGVALGAALGYAIRGSSPAPGGTPPPPRFAAAARTEAAAGEGFTSSDQPSPEHQWMLSFQENLKNASPGQPTPGIVDTIGEALLSDPPLDTARLLFLIHAMPKEDFPVALQLFKTVKSNINRAYNTGNGPIAWTEFWQQYGAIDPENALASALQCGDLNYDGRKLLEKHLFTGLARNNPAAAARTFLALPDLPNRPSAAEGLTFEWAKTNPGAALAWAQQNLDGPALDRGTYAAMWGASTFLDISGGNTLLPTVPEGEMRRSAIQSLKNQVNDKVNLPAAQIIEFMSITRRLGERDVAFEKQVATRCANLDPLGAANFYSRTPEDGTPIDEANLRTVLKTWIRTDRAAAENWAKGEAGKSHYSAVLEELGSVN
jgi:hypothetical protein